MLNRLKTALDDGRADSQSLLKLAIKFMVFLIKARRGAIAAVPVGETFFNVDPLLMQAFMSSAEKVVLCPR